MEIAQNKLGFPSHLRFMKLVLELQASKELNFLLKMKIDHEGDPRKFCCSSQLDFIRRLHLAKTDICIFHMNASI